MPPGGRPSSPGCATLPTEELELRYIARQEHYRPLNVNGKTTDLENRVKKEYFTPGGESGTSLRKIFDPQAAAEFEWGEESSAGKRWCVFRYRVPVENTTLVDRFRVGGLRRGHGDAHPDRDGAGVGHRRGQPVAIGLRLDVRYGLTAIASKEFLLPQHAVENRIRTSPSTTGPNHRKPSNPASLRMS